MCPMQSKIHFFTLKVRNDINKKGIVFHFDLTSDRKNL